MERLVRDVEYCFNDQIENWKDVLEKTLREVNGTLFLIDKATGEPVEAKILFLYSTLIYSGYNCKGIVRIGKDIGTVFIDYTANNSRVFFRINNALSDPSLYNEKIREIVDDLDDDCRYSEAIRSRGLRDLDNTESMEILVKQYHAMQRRNNNPDIQYIEHLHGVASVLKSIAENCKEIPDRVLKVMMQAALGHDLLEDTAIQEFTIEYTISSEVLRLIQELTNPKDDENTDEYMKKLASDSEEARLIKYADLIENTTSFCYSLHEPNIENPIQRAKDFYIPILTKTTIVLAETTFDLYPKTAEAMRMSLKVCTDLLLNRIGLLES